MFRNQLTSLFEHERITTTVAKAKELRPQAERMVTLARTGTLANRRRILADIHNKEIVRKLFDEIAPRFSDRQGGYTRIMRLGRRRGDNAEMAIIEFIDYVPSSDDDSGGPGKTSLMDRAKGMFGGGAKAEADDAPEVEAAEDVTADEPVDEVEEVEAAEPEAVVEEPAAEAEPEEAASEPVTEEPVEEEAAPEPAEEPVVEEAAAEEPEPEEAEAPAEEPADDEEEKKD
jgi:large subunit ribosomal protein L17